MKSFSTKTQLVTVAAVLLLLGGFTAAFAYTTDQNPAGVGAGSNGQPSTTTSSTSPTVKTSTSTTTSVAPTVTMTVTSNTVTTCDSATAVCSYMCRTFFNLKLNPVPVQGAPTDYRYGTGQVFLNLRGDTVYLQAMIRNAEPLTQYSITLDINGVSHLLATMVTDKNGDGLVVAQILLQKGVYAISAQVFDTTHFTSPTLVLKSDSVTVTIPAVTPTAVICDPIPVRANGQVK